MRHKKQCQSGFLHSCECRLLLVRITIFVLEWSTHLIYMYIYNFVVLLKVVQYIIPGYIIQLLPVLDVSHHVTNYWSTAIDSLVHSFVCSFLCLLMRAEVQPTLDHSAETLRWSNLLAQGEEGNW